MKNALKEKFKNNVLVKPLYKKLKNRNKIEPRMLISVDRRFELDGHGISVTRDVANHGGKVLRPKDTNKRKNTFLCNSCGSCKKVHSVDTLQGHRSTNIDVRHGLRGRKMLGATDNIKTENIKADNEVDIEDKTTKLVQADNNIVVLHKVPCTWLRLYPLPKLPEESMCSVIFRCLLCQLGLATFLVLWSFIWIFVIHSFEGPYEIKVSLDFEKAQNQLVIDLATELRQITPLSPRWKAAIEQRIEEARQITSMAVIRGARPRPGQYWDLSGTFLFTVYVMTALGFGAPVPQTILGRTSALMYAVLAVPTHIYLMLNASMCIVAYSEAYVKQLAVTLRNKVPFVLGKTTLGNDNPNCNRNSELLKASNRGGISRIIMRLLGVLAVGRSVPLAGLLYYLIGAYLFGVLRDLGSLESMMFPLEFTTSGQLERIPGHVRIMYGIYVEGAMMLLACALATLRQHTSPRIDRVSENYRLFTTAD